MLLNVCEAVRPETGRLDVPLREGKGEVEIRIVDNGPGVAEPIRKKLFQPFVSYGKQIGIGSILLSVRKLYKTVAEMPAFRPPSPEKQCSD